MKKVVISLLLVVAIIIASFSAYNYARGYKVKENNDNGIITSIEYDGKKYHRMNGEAKYYEFIVDEKISYKYNPILPRTYYTIENDENNDFIYQSVFGGSELYTCLPISKSDDLKQGEITAVLIEKLGYETKKQFENDKEVIDFAKYLSELDTSWYETETFKKNTGKWFYIYFSYDNLPVCSNQSVLIGCYNGKYYLKTEVTDYTFTGAYIENEALERVLGSLMGEIDNEKE